MKYLLQVYIYLLLFAENGTEVDVSHYKEMSEFGQDSQGFYSGGYDGQGYDMGGEGHSYQEPQFGQFDYNQSGGGYGQPYGQQPQFYNPPSPPDTYGQKESFGGTIMTPDIPPATAFEGGENYEDEPPLLEELGINFDHIRQKTLAILNPLKGVDSDVMQDTDMAGPLVFCFAFGGCLLFAGKVQFGYIYGIGVVGCIAMYALLNAMSACGVSFGQIVSILGYCLLPMVILSFIAIMLSLKGVAGVVLTTSSVLWCSVSASKLFVSALAMDSQQLLVAYPCALVYAVFALLTVF